MARSAASGRSWTQRWPFVLAVAAALLIATMGRLDFTVVERFRTTVSDGLTPVLEVLQAPVDLINTAVVTAGDLVNLRAENARLRDEVERLRAWQTTAAQLQAENSALVELLNVVPDAGIRYLTARVVADEGAFVRSVLINAGQEAGIHRGQAVLTGDGLAGRVIEVGRHSARVLLLTDINSRVPVVLEGRPERAVLAGDNGDRGQLLYLPVEAKVEVGDRVMTSGQAGVFPPGLRVGVVTRVGELQGSERTVVVEPYVNWQQLDYVRVADYALPGLLLTGGDSVVPADPPPSARVPAPPRPPVATPATVVDGAPVAEEGAPAAVVEETPAHLPSPKPPLSGGGAG